MIEVALKFKDGEVIVVRLLPHVYNMWMKEMKGSLAKFAKIV